MANLRRIHPVRGSQRGYTLLELLIAITILTFVVIGLLQVFDQLNRFSSVQLNLTDMQQSTRVAQQEIVQMARMAGRGGLGITNVTQGPALSVRNNVTGAESARRVVLTEADSPIALEDTDILTLRGVFNDRIYLVDYTDPASFAPVTGFDPADPRYNLTIANLTKAGSTQPLDGLLEAIDQAGTVEQTLLIVDALDTSIYGVAKLDASTPDPGDDPASVTLVVNANPADVPSVALSSGGAFPDMVGTGVVYVGLLEEYRVYIREDYTVSGDDTSELVPKLSVARVIPGTEQAYGTGNMAIDIADYIFDLQVALGFDTPLAGGFVGDAGDDGTKGIAETADGADDDWLFNAAADQTALGAPPWSGVAPPPIYYARISVLGRTAQPDLNWGTDEDLVAIEDHSYGAGNPSSYNRMNGYTTFNGQQVDARKFRRQIVQTLVDLRNLR